MDASQHSGSFNVGGNCASPDCRAIVLLNSHYCSIHQATRPSSSAGPQNANHNQGPRPSPFQGRNFVAKRGGKNRFRMISSGRTSTPTRSSPRSSPAQPKSPSVDRKRGFSEISKSTDETARPATETARYPSTRKRDNIKNSSPSRLRSPRQARSSFKTQAELKRDYSSDESTHDTIEVAIRTIISSSTVSTENQASASNDSPQEDSSSEEGSILERLRPARASGTRQEVHEALEATPPVADSLSSSHLLNNNIHQPGQNQPVEVPSPPRACVAVMEVTSMEEPSAENATDGPEEAAADKDTERPVQNAGQNGDHSSLDAVSDQASERSVKSIAWSPFDKAGEPVAGETEEQTADKAGGDISFGKSPEKSSEETPQKPARATLDDSEQFSGKTLDGIRYAVCSFGAMPVVFGPRAQTAAEEAVKRTTKRAAESAAESAADNTTENAAERIVDGDAERTAETTADGPAETASEMIAEVTADATADTTAQTTPEVTAEMAAGKAAATTAEPAAEFTTVKPTEKAAESDVETTTEKATDKPAEYTSEDAALLAESASREGAPQLMREQLNEKSQDITKQVAQLILESVQVRRDSAQIVPEPATLSEKDDFMASTSASDATSGTVVGRDKSQSLEAAPRAKSRTPVGSELPAEDAEAAYEADESCDSADESSPMPPAPVSFLSIAERRRKRRLEKFDSTAFDAMIYQQQLELPPPPGVDVPDSVPRVEEPGTSQDADRLYLPVNPAIHRMYHRSDDWHQRKTEEIEQRDRRKEWFGKVTERKRWLRETQAARAKERKKSFLSRKQLERKDPQPWVHYGVRDFGYVPAEELPEDVRSNPAWLKACEWQRETVRVENERYHLAKRQRQETEHYYRTALDQLSH